MITTDIIYTKSTLDGWQDKLIYSKVWFVTSRDSVSVVADIFDMSLCSTIWRCNYIAQEPCMFQYCSLFHSTLSHIHPHQLMWHCTHDPLSQRILVICRSRRNLGILHSIRGHKHLGVCGLDWQAWGSGNWCSYVLGLSCLNFLKINQYVCSLARIPFGNTINDGQEKKYHEW